MTASDCASLVAFPLAQETLARYGLSMADFLDFVRRRKAQLRKELYELETAERVYREAQGDASLSTQAMFATSATDLFQVAQAQQAAPKGIQRMVLHLLDEVYPGGLTALEILDQIQTRWKPSLERTSLSPQLSRLRAQHSIRNDKHKWYLAVRAAGAPSAESAPT